MRTITKASIATILHKIYNKENVVVTVPRDKAHLFPAGTVPYNANRYSGGIVCGSLTSIKPYLTGRDDMMDAYSFYEILSNHHTISTKD